VLQLKTLKDFNLKYSSLFS